MKKKPRYGPEIKAQARELRDAGHTYRSIARLLGGPNVATICYWLNPETATKSIKRNVQYNEENRDRIAEYKAQWRAENRDCIVKYNTQYYEENRDNILQYQAQYHEDNRDRILKRQAQYRKQNPEKIRAKRAKRRASKLNATPPWFTKEHQREIEALQAEALHRQQETDIQHHVDHIYPLTGKTRVNGKYQRTSCGLHVPWNLKVLPGPENRSKTYKLPDPAVDPPTAW